MGVDSMARKLGIGVDVATKLRAGILNVGLGRGYEVAFCGAATVHRVDHAKRERKALRRDARGEAAGAGGGGGGQESAGQTGGE